MFIVFILCCSVFAQDNPSTQNKSSAIVPLPQQQAVPFQQLQPTPTQENKTLEIQKQNNVWRSIKGNFYNQNAFFDAAKQGFERYFRKYSPKMVSRDEYRLIMAADYGKFYVKCTFFIDTNSQHIVTIESDSKGDSFGRRDPIRWIENVVKQVEKVNR